MIDTQVGNCCAVNGLENSSALTQREHKAFRSAEEQLEIDIEAAKERMCAAPDREGKLAHWREMCRLIDQRTPARRRFMARIAGLA